MDQISSKIARIAAHDILEKKGEQLRIVDISHISALADFFVIATASNENQLNAMADAIDESLHREGFDPKQVEGKASGGWILLDYSDVIIHLFDRQNRLFYDLERVWRDGRDMTEVMIRNAKEEKADS